MSTVNLLQAIFLFLFVYLIGLVVHKLCTYKKEMERSFEHTDSTYGEDPVDTSKFTTGCTLLSKECRGDDLWIIFVDEYANMYEEIQSEGHALCKERKPKEE